MARVLNAGANQRRSSMLVIAATASHCAVAALIALGLAGCFEANSDGAAPAASVSGAPGGANAATIAAPVAPAVSQAAPVTVQKATLSISGSSAERLTYVTLGAVVMERSPFPHS